jgi:hypothetical protein
MTSIGVKRATAWFLAVAMAFLNLVVPGSQVMAADHAEATLVAADPGADLGDSFIFLDPNDNTKVVLALTVAGFIVPGEQLNLGFFPSEVVYRFEIENTGDATADRFIDVQFSEQTSRTAPQTASVYLNGIRPRLAPNFTAPTTVATVAPNPNPFNVTTVNGVSFFAGMTDDPFFFDIPAFSRFVSSVLGGTPDPSQFNRSRDTFAGYNVHVVAIELPVAALQGSGGNIIGLNAVTLRSRNTHIQNTGDRLSAGNLVQVDRAGIPAVSTALIPFPRKNEFNSATTAEDAAGRFAGSIVGTLTALGTNQTNIGILASVAVVNGDILRLNTATPNMSLGFGERITTPGYTGFPNGRRPGDDTVDTLLYFITNQALTMGDNVNSNEVPLTAQFPFLGRPHQPLPNSAIDPTQN